MQPQIKNINNKQFQEQCTGVVLRPGKKSKAKKGVYKIVIKSFSNQLFRAASKLKNMPLIDKMNSHDLDDGRSLKVILTKGL